MNLFLNGEWNVRDEEGEYNFQAKVPGTVQGALIKSGKFPHPYIGLNEKLFEKLEEKTWIYTKHFNISEIRENLKYILVFKGIDTLADITLNGKYLGSSEDMFLEYRFDISNIIQKTNVLEVRIKSPIHYPRTLEKNYGRLASTHEESSRPYIRKAQYSYGWDWGARMATSGIWKDVYIESYPDGRLFGSSAYLENFEKFIHVNGYVKDIEEKIENYKVNVLMDGESVGTFSLFRDERGVQFEGSFQKKDAELWYPNGMGKSVLHDFAFILLKNGEQIYREDKKIGLRIVRIIKENDGEGETFILEINGKRVFAKGANWIPADNILDWITKKDYDVLLSMAKNANMNILRVWGGGIYENEEFYTKCDELGIMVWQDFMFACAEYPDHLEWFRKLANEEVRENLIKLRHHPSIVLWCGNNENNWGFDEWRNFAHKVNGEFLGNRLYLHDFPKICAQEDPSRPYWPSSPYGGSKSNAEDGGDRHVWNVWSGWQDYSEYLNDKGKFISEFGFQAAPHPETIDFFAKDEDKNIFSDVMINHNKQIEGPERIMKFINNHFGLVSDFDAIVYLSQINQAEAIKTGVEHWRTRKYKTAGTIYWQLNDSWPVFSWSAVDYFKRPKALYYYTTRFYSPILAILETLDNKLQFTIVNDEKTEKINAKIEVWNLENGEKELSKEYHEITIAEDSVTTVDKIDMNSDILHKSIAHVEINTEGKRFENTNLFANLREIKLSNPHISYRKTKDSTIEISCEKPAYGIMIKSEDEIFDDNFFSLFPSQKKLIKDVKKEVEILSMYDFQQKLSKS